MKTSYLVSEETTLIFANFLRCKIQILVQYKSKDPNHVEWAKALKDLYLPGLRDYVKSHYPLGPVWSTTGKAMASAPSKAPAPPPPPPASLFSPESSQPSSSKPKEGMAAVFQEISSGKSVTTGSLFLHLLKERSSAKDIVVHRFWFLSSQVLKRSQMI